MKYAYGIQGFTISRNGPDRTKFTHALFYEMDWTNECICVHVASSYSIGITLDTFGGGTYHL